MERILNYEENPQGSRQDSSYLGNVLFPFIVRISEKLLLTNFKVDYRKSGNNLLTEP